MRKIAVYLFLFLVSAMVMYGQGSVTGRITGVVTDNSGAALQGAEVTANSPALLKPKQLKSVSGGVYLLEDLPPGSYEITTVMPGFKTFKQEGIVLTAGFTATVNIPLAVGDTSETVEVTGAAPIVDVQGGETSTTFDSALLANTPSGNDPWSTLEQTPGVTSTTVDVGGNNSYQQSQMSVHGSKLTEQTYAMNGLPLNSASGPYTDYYFDYYSFQEMQVITDAAPPEIPTGGAYLNMITRQGSNDVHGFVSMNYEDDKTQTGIKAPTYTDINGNNQVVLNAGSPFIRAYDFAAQAGGPIIKDRIWLFGAYRAYQLKQQLFASPLPNPTTGAPAPSTNPGLYGFGTDINHQSNTTLRADYQINNKNVVNAMWHWQYINRFYRRLTYSYVDQNAAQRQIEPAYILQAQETYTPTSHMTLDTRIGYLQVIFPLRYEPGVATSTISAADVGLSTLKYAGQENYVDKEQVGRATATLSWFKGGWGGSHNFKLGVDVSRNWRRQLYDYNQETLEYYNTTSATAPLTPTIPNSAPAYVRIENGPINFNDTAPALAIFLQDAWTINRHVTLSVGTRYDHANAFIPQQCNPAVGVSVYSPLFPNRCLSQIQSAYSSLISTPGITRTQLGPLTNFASVNNYDNVVPRVSISYDPTGKGDQVVRAGFNMFTNNVGTSLADAANPNGTGYVQYGWNGSTIAGSGNSAINSATPDYTQFAPACGANIPGTGGCLAGGTYTGGAANGKGGYQLTGGGIASFVDPNLKRPYSYEYNIGYQRSVFRDVSVSVAFYHRVNKNLQITKNINAPTADYTPITSVNPLTKQPITLYALTGNSTTCAASSNHTDYGCNYNETTNDPLADQNHYNGLEFTLTKRLTKKWSALAGFTIQKDHGILNSGDFNDPNVRINNYGSLDQDSTYVARVDFTYKLPFKFQTSVNYQHETGYPVLATNLFTGLLAGSGQTETVNLMPNGSLRYPSVDLTNLRLGRETRLSERFKLETSCDLFNLFNVAPTTAETTTYGGNFGRPTNFVGPFIARFNGKLSF